ncbi:unnamed protein product [Leptidea sinapis]|uniref:CNNM transmembrane domain-containing protein n=1 Tax=Leptidea sinapis TaxID=189913 RepID=A0A5E4QQI0_9NEOP|nr:unnamed protein product [Leptidea sinapis]
MAFVSNALRTCSLIFYLFNVLCFAEHRSNEPWIVSFKISAKACVDSKCKYLLLVQGGEFLGHNSWSLTSSEGARGANCDILFSNYEIKEVKTEKWISQMEVLVPMSAKKLYFCLNHSGGKNHPFHGRWVHQGQYLFLDPVNDTTFTVKEKTHTLGDQEMKIRKPNNEGSSWADLSHDIDVNYITNAARPTREEQKDIEVLSGDKYVPLDEKADEHENIIDNDDQNMNDKRKLQYLKDDEMLIGSRFVPIGEVKVSGNSGNRNDGMDQNMYSIESDASNFSKRKLQYLRHSVRNIALNVPDIKDDLKDVINSDIGTNEHDSDKDDSFFSIFDNNDLENDINTKVLNKKVSIGRLKYNTKENVESNFSPVPEQAEKNGDFNDFGSKGKALKSHKGNDIDFEEVQYFSDKNPGGMRGKRQVNFDDFSVVRADPAVHIDGLRVEVSSKDPKLFGQGLTQRTVIAFTYDALEYGLPCKFLLKGEYLAKEDSVTATSALFEFTAPSPISASKLYICAKNLNPGITDPTKDEDKYLHQGMESWKVISTHDKLLPLWATLVLILFCLGFSALFSGLNLGLMSLDRTELKIISNTGTEQERKHARAIMPVRDHGNYLLCSILLGNVAVNSTFTILLDDLTSGLFAVIFSTLSIDEVNIISGALELRKKKVTEVMTKLEDVFMLPITSILDFETMSEIIKSVDNRTKKRRNRPQNKLQDFAAFAERHENQRIHISPQLTLATFQFLSTTESPTPSAMGSLQNINMDSMLRHTFVPDYSNGKYSINLIQIKIKKMLPKTKTERSYRQRRRQESQMLPVLHLILTLYLDKKKAKFRTEESLVSFHPNDSNQPAHITSQDIKSLRKSIKEIDDKLKRSFDESIVSNDLNNRDTSVDNRDLDMRFADQNQVDNMINIFFIS